MKRTNNKEYIEMMRSCYGDEVADSLFKKWGCYLSYDLSSAFVELKTDIDPNITFKYDTKKEATNELIKRIKIVKNDLVKLANEKISKLIEDLKN